MHRSTHINRDGDTAKHLQVQSPAAVSSGRRISGSKNFSVEFLMKNTCGALVGSSRFFLGWVIPQIILNSIRRYIGSPTLSFFVVNDAYPANRIRLKPPSIEVVLTPGRLSEVVRSIVRLVPVNVVDDLRKIWNINPIANCVDESVNEAFRPIYRDKPSAFMDGSGDFACPFSVVPVPPA